MKILVLWKIKPGADTSGIADMLLAEERFAWKTYLDGTLREHYQSDMPVPAISILEMDSVDAAKATFAELPIMKAGLLEPEYYPLNPFTNWEVLFRDEEKVATA